MRMEHLREFVVLASCMNFSTAAEKLHLSQPALSNHIADIEKELGYELFERKAKSELTHQGKIFCEGAWRILGEYERTIVALRKSTAGTAGTLRIKQALGYSRCGQFYLRAINAFAKQNPAVDVTLSEGRGANLFESLRDGTLDCGGLEFTEGVEVTKLAPASV